MATAAFAARSAIQDRTITMAEARKLAIKASDGSAIPITVNQRVLSQLNRFVGTAEGRKFVQEGLTRMPQYRDMIERKIGEYGMPEELIAVAMFESGFKNDVVSPVYHAAGIWQFVPQTARHYGLVVTPTLDERLNPEKETDAAMRYLRKLDDEFQDWRLALKAYNEGESHVEDLIETYGTRDPWALEDIDSREDYLAGTMAMILIVKNPSILQ